MSVLLLARKLFEDGENNYTDEEDKTVCPEEDTSGPPIVPLFGDMTYHTFSTILAGACGLLSLLIIALLIFRHATHYSSPVQQRQIIRIVLLVPWVALFCFLIVWQTDAGHYLLESLDFGSAIAISGFLLLLCDYVLSNPDGFDALFGKGALARGQFTGSSPGWLKRNWYAVLQFIPTSIIIWIATAASSAAGTYCASSNSPHFAHIWITIFKMIVTVAAIVACFRFSGRMKTQLEPHRFHLKFWAFKGIIGVNLIQTFIINILIGQEVLKPTSHMTYHDITVALPCLILACEMPLFAILMLFAFPASPYLNRKSQASPFKAVFDAFNITDLLSAFVRGPMRLVREQQMGMARQDSMKLIPNAEPPTYENVQSEVIHGRVQHAV